MTRHPTPAERDERIVLPLDPEEALRGLLAVKPDEDECPLCGGPVVAIGSHTVTGEHQTGECVECKADVHRPAMPGKPWTVMQRK